MTTIEMPETAEIKKLKAAAQKYFDKICKAGAMESTSSMTIGYNAYQLKSRGMFGVLGFATESEARAASGVCEATWYANIRLAEAFKDVPEEMFVKLKQANAKALADMPESKRCDTLWLRMAETMKIEEFAAKVDEAMEGKARPSDGKERFNQRLSVSMSASRKKAVEMGLKEYTLAVGAGEDISKGLELMVAESTGGAGLMEAISKGIDRIKEAKALIQGSLSADEVLVRIDAIMGDMVIEFAKALEQASQKHDAAA